MTTTQEEVPDAQEDVPPAEDVPEVEDLPRAEPVATAPDPDHVAVGAGIIRWEGPPPPHADRNQFSVPHEMIAITLKRRPGNWAVICESPRGIGMASRIADGRLRAYARPGSFEAVTRNLNGIQTIYARYVGDPAATDG